MQSQCSQCDRVAARMVGPDALCSFHARFEMTARKRPHHCSKCYEEQPPNVAWYGGACGKCGGTDPNKETRPT